MPQGFNAVPITLADGVLRHLQYSLGDVRRIKAKYMTKPTKVADNATVQDQISATPLGQLLEHSAEEILPELIMIGVVEKEGLTEQILSDKLLTGPMIEYVQTQFIEAFFGGRERRWLEAILGGKDAAVERMEAALKERQQAAMPKEPEIQTPPNPIVQ